MIFVLFWKLRLYRGTYRVLRSETGLQASTTSTDWRKKGRGSQPVLLSKWSRHDLCAGLLCRNLRLQRPWSGDGDEGNTNHHLPYKDHAWKNLHLGHLGRNGAWYDHVPSLNQIPLDFRRQEWALHPISASSTALVSLVCTSMTQISAGLFQSNFSKARQS